jgi:hypothetical protein
MSRQVESLRIYTVDNGLLRRQAPSGAGVPSDGWNRFELANDDDDSPPGGSNSEQNTKTNDHVYQIDGPGLTFVFTHDFYVYRANFREFVRFKFGPDLTFAMQSAIVDGRIIANVDGSRGSSREPWHLSMYAKRSADGIVHGRPQLIEFDNDVVSASAPQFAGTGNGTIAKAPSLSDKTLTDKTPTAGWKAVFDNKSQAWTLTMTEHKKGKEVETTFGPFKKNSGTQARWRRYHFVVARCERGQQTLGNLYNHRRQQSFC